MLDFNAKIRYHRYQPTAVLKVTGEDAFSFLQGQFTQDIKAEIVGVRIAYGLWLNQKGKVLADSYVWQCAGYWLVASLSSAAGVIREQLEAHVIADDVTITDETERWVGLSLLGENAAEVFRGRAGVSLPKAGCFWANERGYVFPGRRAVELSWEWLYPVGADSLGVALNAAQAVELDLTAMEQLRIVAGIPAVPCDIGPEDLPNEGGLDRDAISYTKGCYLGQEVMARLKTMGQVRRRLMRVAGSIAPPSVLPAPLFADGVKIGELRSVARTEDGLVGLAMVSLLGLKERRLVSFSSDNPGNLVITDVLA
jgi:folate-binding protein YgfZ